MKRTPTVLNDYLAVFLPDNFDYKALSEQLGLNLIHYFENQIDSLGILNVNLSVIKLLFVENLRYCPLCMKSGFHSNLYQLKNIAFCSFHKTIALRDTCGKCKLPINLYSATIDYADYYCKCGKLLTESNDFRVMTCLWVKATKQIYLETPFSVKQFVILDTSSSERFCTFVNSHSFQF